MDGYPDLMLPALGTKINLFKLFFRTKLLVSTIFSTLYSIFENSFDAYSDCNSV